MNLHTLENSPGSVRNGKRKGRGPGSTLGKTSGRGQKGQKARNTVARGFEGGQTPLRRRIPRRGFHNPFKEIFAVINLGELTRRKALSKLKEIDPDVLLETRVIRRKGLPVKVLGTGEIARAVTVKAHKFSKSAAEKIQAAGGQAIVIGGEEAANS